MFAHAISKKQLRIFASLSLVGPCLCCAPVQHMIFFFFLSFFQMSSSLSSLSSFRFFSVFGDCLWWREGSCLSTLLWLF